jgi:hypothetical protein
MNLVQELSEALKKMGKRIKVSYFKEPLRGSLIPGYST